MPTVRTQSSPKLFALVLLACSSLLLSAAPASAEPVGGNGAVGREVFGFFDRSQRQYMLEVADYSVLTTVAFFAIDARPDGHLHKRTPAGAQTEDWAAWNSDWMTQVIGKAHAAGTRVVMTVRRFGWSSAERTDMIALLSSSTARATLATEIADAVAARGVDGVNLDFEPMPARVAAEFVAFVREVRSELDARRKGLQLTFDATGYGTNYDVASLTGADAADAVLVMGYPYHGSWSQRAGAVSPLSGSGHDLTETVDDFLARTSPEKIILGLPYYGYEWSTETRRLGSPVRAGGTGYGKPRSRRLDSAIRLGRLHGRRWDSAQLVPWTRWLYRACSGCPRTWRQLYYDDRQSLGLKYDLVNDRDLAGVGIWALGFEGDRPGLYRLLAEKFPPAAR